MFVYVYMWVNVHMYLLFRSLPLSLSTLFYETESILARQPGGIPQDPSEPTCVLLGFHPQPFCIGAGDTISIPQACSTSSLLLSLALVLVLCSFSTVTKQCS